MIAYASVRKTTDFTPTRPSLDHVRIFALRSGLVYTSYVLRYTAWMIPNPYLSRRCPLRTLPSYMLLRLSIPRIKPKSSTLSSGKGGTLSISKFMLAVPKTEPIPGPFVTPWLSIEPERPSKGIVSCASDEFEEVRGWPGHSRVGTC